MPASDVQTSHGPTLPSGRRYSRWSPSQSESKPTDSAVWAMSSSSGQRTERSTSGSCTPTLRGRPFTRPSLVGTDHRRVQPLGERRRAAEDRTAGLERGEINAEQIGLGHRPGEQVTLAGGDAKLAHHAQLRGRLETLGDDVCLPARG